MLKDTQLKKKFEEKCLELSYKYDNEITLAIDDLWSFIHSALESERKQLEREIRGMKLNKDFKYFGYEKIDGYLMACDELLDLLKKETI